MMALASIDRQRLDVSSDCPAIQQPAAFDAASTRPASLTFAVATRIFARMLHCPRQPNTHRTRCTGCPTSRAFVPWRLSDAGLGAPGEVRVAGIRNPSQQQTCVLAKTSTRGYPASIIQVLKVPEAILAEQFKRTPP